MTATDGAIVEPAGATTESVIEKIEMTAAELEALKQKEGDRRVTDAEKKWKADFKTEMEKAIAEAKKDAEEKAKLSEEERYKLEREKEKAELDKERAEFRREKLLLETERNLAQEQLPPEFANFLIGKDTDETAENIVKLKGFFEQKVQESVDERLKGKSPKIAGQAPTTRYTREQVEDMTRDEVAANLAAIEESMKSWK
jgi:hypothetical protein